jgi:hypothetical protein
VGGLFWLCCWWSGVCVGVREGWVGDQNVYGCGIKCHVQGRRGVEMGSDPWSTTGTMGVVVS